MIDDFDIEIASIRRKYPWPWVVRDEIRELIKRIDFKKGWFWMNTPTPILSNEDMSLTLFPEWVFARVRVDGLTIAFTTREWFLLKKQIKNTPFTLPVQEDAWGKLMEKMK